MRWPRTAAQHGGHAGMQRILDLLRTNEMDVAVKTACGQDFTLACDNFCARANDNINPRLGIGIAGLAQRGNAAVAQRHIRFVDAGIVQNKRIGDHRISRAICAGYLRLAHAVADHFPATEFDLFTIGG